MGPLNGGMSYPEAFQGRQGLFVTVSLWLAHRVNSLMHRLMPGKLRADMLLVANNRTRVALPAGIGGEVMTVIENGVDLSIWWPPVDEPEEGGPVRIVFVGRLIECKAVDLLLEAFRDLIARTPATLDLAGDGRMRPAWEAKAKELGLGESVRFLGWLSQEACADLLRKSDILVLPSLHECGGAVVLEAMAVGLPVVAANWGGPADYLDPSCGILVNPTSGESFIKGLADALSQLSASPRLRRELGQSGRERIIRDFDWNRKIERFLDIYKHVLGTKPDPEPSRCRQAEPLDSALSWPLGPELAVHGPPAMPFREG